MAREKGSDENGISFGYHPGHAPAGDADEGGEAEKEKKKTKKMTKTKRKRRRRKTARTAMQTEAVDRRNRVKEVGLVSCWAH